MVTVGKSLRRTLTSRLLLWQLAGLLALAVISVFIFYYDNEYTGARFDFDIAHTLAESVISDGDRLQLESSEDLREVFETSPGLWYVVQDESGRRLIGGSVPPRLTSLVDALSDVQSIEIIGTAPDFGGAMMLHENSRVGSVRVLFGGGSEPTGLAGLLSFAGREVSPMLGGLVVLMAVMTLIVVPPVVSTTLNSLRAVERVASRIDIEQRGVRLPNDEVPSEVAALVNAINAALSRLDDGYAEKQRFLSDAAHELRTPIAILLNRLELSRKGEFDQRVLMDVHRLANLAEQLLDLQRIEHQDLPPQRVDLVSLSRNVMADLAPLAIAGGYDPVFETAVEEFVVLGDASSLERGLINLVQNAIAHGGGQGEISLSVKEDWSITISDGGPGVPEDRRDCIFEPFHRIKPLNEGSGLGLSLVKEIVRRHNGTISVGSSPAGGARFLLRFEPAP
ncbi:MAG: two component sensor kinase [Devosia sp.]|nr:two component sensor kinase [Devosia sp.]